MTAVPTLTTVAVDSSDGRHRLAARLWCHEHPRAVLIIAHGHGEHGGCYAGLAGEILPALEVDVLALDFRGHGLSSGRRGVLRSYQNLLDDLATWLQWVSRERSGLPIFVLGHSNGGLATIRLIESQAPHLAGLILSNPSLQLTAEAPLWKRLAGQVLLRVAPWITLQTGIEGKQLTGAAESVAVIDTDPLRHQRISPPTYFGMVANGPIAIDQANRVTTPTLVILGGADPITAPSAGRRFFDQLGALDKTLLVFESMRHEPLHDVGRDEVVAAIVAWIAQRINLGEPG